MLGHNVHSCAAHRSRRVRSSAPLRSPAGSTRSRARRSPELPRVFAEGAARARRPPPCSPAPLLRVLTLLPARSPATTVLVRAAACSARSRVGRSLESPRSLAGVAECVRRRCCRSAARARRLASCSSVSPLQALALPAVRAHAAGPLDGRRWPCVRWSSLD